MRANPWSGVLHSASLSARPWGTAEDTVVYSLGYVIDAQWSGEGSFDWRPMPVAGYRIDGRYRRDRHRHPLFIVRNNPTGEHFIGQFAWSGGVSFEFDLRGGPGMSLAQTCLSFRAGMDAPAPLRLLAPGETVGTPKMHMGFVIGDLDAAIQGMHDHIRRSVMLPQPRGRRCWVESGIGPEFELTPEEGMVVRLGAPLTSELLICEAVV